MRQKFNLYFTSSCPIIKDYLDTKRSEWEEDKDFIEDQLRYMALNKYKNLITSVGFSNKYPKDAQILVLLGLAQKISDDSKKSSENPTHTTGSQLRESQPTSRTSHPGFWKRQNVEWYIKPRTENNIGGTSNTALKRASGSDTNHKTTVSGPACHQTLEETLIHQVR